MKTKLISALALILGITSCNNESDICEINNDRDSIYQVSVSFEPEISMNPITRGMSSETLATYCTNLDVYFIGASGTQTVVKQTSDEPNFGNISVGLKNASYTIIAFAYNGEATTGRVNGSSDAYIEYPEYFTGDCFSAYKSSFQSSQQTKLTMTMKRPISKFKVSLTSNTIPDDVSKIVIKVNNICKRFQGALGNGKDPSTEYIVKEFPISTYKEKDFEICFLPYISSFEDPHSGTVDVIIEGYNKSNEVIETRSLEKVKVSCGYVTTYSGSLFSDKYLPFDLTISPTWGEYNGTF